MGGWIENSEISGLTVAVDKWISGDGTP